MKIVGDFVLDPCEFQRPSLRISPFRTADIGLNVQWPRNTRIDEYFRQRFPGRGIVYTRNGREAIALALKQLCLTGDDCVTILTTTGNHYISGCVTREIEKVCRWSRKLEPSTRVLFVNHEFGFAYENLAKLKEHGLVIIEDICHSFASDNAEASLGQVGDFVVASFPKFFPIQGGGLLVHSSRYELPETLDAATKTYCQSVLSHYQDEIEAVCQRRRANHEYLARTLGQWGLMPRFALTERSIPGVFMFRVPEATDLLAMKAFMAHHGIQGGGFHKEATYFVPVHQNLTDYELRYICEVAVTYLREAGLPLAS